MEPSDLQFAILHLPMVFGPGDKQRRFGWVIRPMSERRGRLDVAVHCGAWRSTYGYVEDVADGIALAALHPAAARRIFNIGYPNAPDTAAWALTIAKLVGRSGEFGLSERRATPAVVPRGLESLNFAYPLVADTRRIREELAYVERVEGSDALLKTIEDELARPEL